MLGKLVKYDLKYGIRIFAILHVILIIACILGRIFFMDKVDYSNQKAVISFIAIFSTMYIMLFSSVSFGTFFLIAVRFYRNLFTSEGYLTWTLPATPTQQFGAKIISGSIWMSLSILIGGACALLLVTGQNTIQAYSKVSADITETIGMPVSEFLLYMFLYTLFCTAGSVILIYLSIAIGQLFPGHRILCSIIAYFCVSIVSQLAYMALLSLFRIYPYYDPSRVGIAVAEHTLMIYKISFGLSIVQAVIGYVAANYILNKKVNLN